MLNYIIWENYATVLIPMNKKLYMDCECNRGSQTEELLKPVTVCWTHVAV